MTFDWKQKRKKEYKELARLQSIPRSQKTHKERIREGMLEGSLNPQYRLKIQQ